MTPGPGIEPRTHWWKASAITTAPPLLPNFLGQTGTWDQVEDYLSISILTYFLHYPWYVTCYSSENCIMSCWAILHSKADSTVQIPLISHLTNKRATTVSIASSWSTCLPLSGTQVRARSFYSHCVTREVTLPVAGCLQLDQNGCDPILRESTARNH